MTGINEFATLALDGYGTLIDWESGMVTVGLLIVARSMERGESPDQEVRRTSQTLEPRF